MFRLNSSSCLDFGTDAPDATDTDDDGINLDLGDIAGSDDGLFGATAFSASATGGTVDSLAFAQASLGVVSYTLDAGTYLVTQTVTPMAVPSLDSSPRSSLPAKPSPNPLN